MCLFYFQNHSQEQYSSRIFLINSENIFHIGLVLKHGFEHNIVTWGKTHAKSS